MNIQGHRKKLIMNLEQALLKYGNDISYIILRDGTNIEIIDDYQNDNDEFVEEKFEDNTYNNYIYKEIDQNGTLLRGRGIKKTSGKPLRKTILKSTIKEQGNLRNNTNDKKAVIKLSESNEYLQCAYGFKFFNSKESEEETESNASNNNNNQAQIQNQQINNNNFNPQMNIPPQFPKMPNQQQYKPPIQPNIPKQVMPSQPRYNQNIQNNQNQPYQFPPKYPPQQQQYPPYQQQIPRGPQQRMNMNIPSQPQPQTQQRYYNNNQIPKGNMRIPFNNNNNQIFRARNDRNSGRLIQKENNMNINKYPGSAQKRRNPEYNLINEEREYVDNNNFGNYYYEKDIRHYEYPPVKNNNNYFVFGHSSNKKREDYYQENEVNEFQENDYYGY